MVSYDLDGEQLSSEDSKVGLYSGKIRTTAGSLRRLETHPNFLMPVNDAEKYFWSF